METEKLYDALNTFFNVFDCITSKAFSLISE